MARKAIFSFYGNFWAILFFFDLVHTMWVWLVELLRPIN